MRYNLTNVVFFPTANTIRRELIAEIPRFLVLLRRVFKAKSEYRWHLEKVVLKRVIMVFPKYTKSSSRVTFYVQERWNQNEELLTSQQLDLISKRNKKT